ncbi:MAG: energy-coupled thiamine transporter ThiT [Lachnospiraceae bacterium]|nr:energy-coupled thiamine transporter ThiT [Lachnospiraceae bacterium]
MSYFFQWSDESYEYILTKPGYILLALLTVIVLFFITAMRGREGRQFDTRSLIFCSLAVALGVLTSFMRITTLPFGGSVTLFSMLAISFMGFVYGPGIGVTTGVAFGLLDLMIEPYIYHPIQVLLDYILAFGALGLSGFFADRKNGLLKGYIVGVAARYVCHVLSGYIFFASYAPEGTNPLIYTLTYNLTFILPEMIATIILISIPSVSSALLRLKGFARGESSRLAL